MLLVDRASATAPAPQPKASQSDPLRTFNMHSGWYEAILCQSRQECLNLFQAAICYEEASSYSFCEGKKGGRPSKPDQLGGEAWKERGVIC